MIKRPHLDVEAFELALENAGLDASELEIIEHIRYIGIFDELSLRKSLALPTKPLVPEPHVQAAACTASDDCRLGRLGRARLQRAHAI